MQTQQYAEMPVRCETWQRTGELRYARNPNRLEPGPIDRLQVAWRCLETGETHWRDVPIIDVTE